MNNVILETRALSKNFGMLAALSDVNFCIEEGTIHSIIGPNGAGKTTFFNVLTGRLKPSNGTIHFQSKNITGLPVHRISHLGLSRSFQITNVMRKLSVFENVRLAVQSRGHKNFHLFAPPEKMVDVNEKTIEVLQKVHLLDVYDQHADNLSHGELRQLEIGMTLATDPSLMLLDEPTAGMNPEELVQMMDIIRKIHGELGLAIFLIEHRMKVVMELCQRIQTLVFGEVIAEGTPEEIQSNPSVIDAYLGKEMVE